MLVIPQSTAIPPFLRSLLEAYQKGTGWLMAGAPPDLEQQITPPPSAYSRFVEEPIGQKAVRLFDPSAQAPRTREEIPGGPVMKWLTEAAGQATSLSGLPGTSAMLLFHGPEKLNIHPTGEVQVGKWVGPYTDVAKELPAKAPVKLWLGTIPSREELAVARELAGENVPEWELSGVGSGTGWESLETALKGAAQKGKEFEAGKQAALPKGERLRKHDYDITSPVPQKVVGPGVSVSEQGLTIRGPKRQPAPPLSREEPEITPEVQAAIEKYAAPRGQAPQAPWIPAIPPWMQQLLTGISDTQKMLAQLLSERGGRVAEAPVTPEAAPQAALPAPAPKAAPKLEAAASQAAADPLDAIIGQPHPGLPGYKVKSRASVEGRPDRLTIESADATGRTRKFDVPLKWAQQAFKVKEPKQITPPAFQSLEVGHKVTYRPSGEKFIVMERVGDVKNSKGLPTGTQYRLVSEKLYKDEKTGEYAPATFYRIVKPGEVIKREGTDNEWTIGSSNYGKKVIQTPEGEVTRTERHWVETKDGRLGWLDAEKGFYGPEKHTVDVRFSDGATIPFDVKDLKRAEPARVSREMGERPTPPEKKVMGAAPTAAEAAKAQAEVGAQQVVTTRQAEAGRTPVGIAQRKPKIPGTSEKAAKGEAPTPTVTAQLPAGPELKFAPRSRIVTNQAMIEEMESLRQKVQALETQLTDPSYSADALKQTEVADTAALKQLHNRLAAHQNLLAKETRSTVRGNIQSKMNQIQERIDNFKTRSELASAMRQRIDAMKARMVELAGKIDRTAEIPPQLTGLAGMPEVTGGTELGELPKMREAKSQAAEPGGPPPTQTGRLVAEYTKELDRLNAKLAGTSDVAAQSAIRNKIAKIQQRLSKLTSKFGEGVSSEEADKLMDEWMKGGG